MDSLIVRHNMETLAGENVRFLSKVYSWMSIGLALTTWIAYIISSKPQFYNTRVNSPLLFWGIIAAHLIILIYISAYLKKMSCIVSSFIFFLYSGLSAVTFSIIFLCFLENSIHVPLAVLALSFFTFAITTRLFKQDWSRPAIIFGFAIFEVFFFLMIKRYCPLFFSESAHMKLNITFLAITTIIIAFSSKKVKKLPQRDSSICSSHGALKLYADFLNLFLFFLRLSSRK